MIPLIDLNEMSPEDALKIIGSHLSAQTADVINGPARDCSEAIEKLKNGPYVDGEKFYRQLEILEKVADGFKTFRERMREINIEYPDLVKRVIISKDGFKFGEPGDFM